MVRVRYWQQWMIDDNTKWRNIDKLDEMIKQQRKNLIIKRGNLLLSFRVRCTPESSEDKTEEPFSPHSQDLIMQIKGIEILCWFAHDTRDMPRDEKRKTTLKISHDDSFPYSPIYALASDISAISHHVSIEWNFEIIVQSWFAFFFASLCLFSRVICCCANKRSQSTLRAQAKQEKWKWMGRRWMNGQQPSAVTSDRRRSSSAAPFTITESLLLLLLGDVDFLRFPSSLIHRHHKIT